MDPKDKQIIKLLKTGVSYSEIQNQLGVSPNRIANVKKDYFFENSSNDALFRTTRCDSNDDRSTISDETFTIPCDKVQSITQSYDSTNAAMPPKPSHYPLSEAEIELEKFKLQMQHEVTLEKFKRTDREIALREEELRLKRDQFEQELAKQDGIWRVLNHRLRKIVTHCQEGEWNADEMEDMISATQKLLTEAEENSFLYGIKVDSRIDTEVLKEIIRFFSYHFEDMDSEEVIDIEFDKKLKECLERFID